MLDWAARTKHRGPGDLSAIRIFLMCLEAAVGGQGASVGSGELPPPVGGCCLLVPSACAEERKRVLWGPTQGVSAIHESSNFLTKHLPKASPSSPITLDTNTQSITMYY